MSTRGKTTPDSTAGSFTHSSHSDVAGGTSNDTMGNPTTGAPVKLTSPRYRKERNALEAELAMAQAAVAKFDSDWKAAGEPSVSEAAADAWNDAHDHVTKVEFDIRFLDGQWRRRNIDSNTLALMRDNID